MSNLRVFNFAQTTPNAISKVLRSLDLAHSVLTKRGQSLTTLRVKGKGNLPVKIVILSVIEVVAKMEPVVPTIVFSCLPESLINTILDTDDIDMITIKDSDHLQNTVRWALAEGLASKKMTIGLRHKTPSQYIEEVSPPSFLDKYNTAKCKINPYDLRAPMHKVAIGYLYGKVTKAETTRFLASSLKFNTVKEVLFSKAGVSIKAAVAKTRKGVSPVDAASEFNLDCFEITYVIQSYAKLYKEPK